MAPFIAPVARLSSKLASRLWNASDGFRPGRQSRRLLTAGARYVVHTVDRFGAVVNAARRGLGELPSRVHPHCRRAAAGVDRLPAISTGAYRYPVDQASQIAVSSAARAAEGGLHSRGPLRALRYSDARALCAGGARARQAADVTGLERYAKAALV